MLEVSYIIFLVDRESELSQSFSSKPSNDDGAKTSLACGGSRSSNIAQHKIVYRSPAILKSSTFTSSETLLLSRLSIKFLLLCPPFPLQITTFLPEQLAELALLRQFASIARLVQSSASHHTTSNTSSFYLRQTTRSTYSIKDIAMPDLNSLPPSRSISGASMSRINTNNGEIAALRGQSPSPSPRSAVTSLQAAAAVNAGLQHEESRRKHTRTLGGFQISADGNRIIHELWHPPTTFKRKPQTFRSPHEPPAE